MDKINNIKIGVRLISSFSLLIIGLLVIVIISVTRLNSIENSINDTSFDKFPKTIWANDIIDNFNEGCLAIRDILLVNTSNDVQKQKEKIKKLAVKY